MAETPESNKAVNSQPQPSKVLSPKRGAIPTPRADIDKATPYIPDTDQERDTSAREPVSPSTIGHEEDSKEEFECS